MGLVIVDADIQSYFDTIDHEILMKLMAKRISDRRVLKLLRKWLKAGVMEDGRVTPTETGSPQGGVISPLLANIYLHLLDTYWTQNCVKLGRLFRYADDCVIVCRTQQDALRAKQIAGRILKLLKLTLHAKTRIVPMDREGFDFLGFHFHKMKSKKTGRLAPYMWPSPKAMNAARNIVKEKTKRSRLRKQMGEIVEELNPVIRGWRNYFHLGNATKKLQDLDRYVRQRLGRSARARKGCRGCLDVRSFAFWFDGCGVERFYLPAGRAA